MISGLDPSAARFLSDLSRSQSRADRAARQISSGLKVTTASDAPEEVGAILRLQAGISQTQQVRSNLGRVKTEVDTAEKALQSSVTLLERALVLASQGTGPNQTADTRAVLATEIEGLQQQLIAIGNTVVDGRYIFSGDQDQSPSYEKDPDPASTTGVTLLLTGTATRQVEDAAGGRFQVSRTAEEILGANVFGSLQSLRNALLGNDLAAIEAAVPAVEAAGKHLNAQLAFYGTAQNRVAAALEGSTNTELQLNTELAGRREADLAEAILELTQAQTQRDATLSLKANRPNTSLFDLLG